MTVSGGEYRRIATICTAWWRSLRGLDEHGKAVMINGKEKPPDRAALAELRRIGVVVLDGAPYVDEAGALSISAFRQLVRRLGITPAAVSAGGSRGLAPVAIAAATLARIREDAGSGGTGLTARMLGEGGDESRLLAEARFKRLIRTRNDPPALHAQARRVAAVLERKAPVGDLGASLILWDRDPRITRYWVFIPPNRDRKAVEARMAELRRQGVLDLSIRPDNAISLGVFSVIRIRNAPEHEARTHRGFVDTW